MAAAPTPPARDGALLAAVAALAVVPALGPGGEAYLDNPPHLVETLALAEALAAGRLHGWSELALAGFVPHQLNAPLVWVPLALAVLAGVPVVPAYLAAIAAANVGFALGVWRFAGALWRRPEAAWLAAGLAATWPAGLWSIGGAAAGMFPWRLGLGLLFAGLAPSDRDPRWLRDAAWAALCLAAHTFTGLLAFGWLAVRAVVEPRAARPRGLALVAAVGATAWIWGPWLDPDTRRFFVWSEWDPAWVVAFLAGGLDPYPGGPAIDAPLIGGVWGGLATAVLWLGAALVRGGVADPGLARRTGGAFVLLVGVAAAATLTRAEWLGPVPWRFLTLGPVALALMAGAGLAHRLPPVAHRPLLGALAAVAALAGLEEARPRGLGIDREAWADLDATWAALARAAPAGRVYHEDPAGDPAQPLPHSHVGPLLTVRHGLPTLGSWYGVTAVAVHGYTGWEYAWSAVRRAAEAGPEALRARLWVYRVGAVVTTSPGFAAAVAAVPGAREVARQGDFAAFVLDGPPRPAVLLDRGAARVREAGPGEVRADLPGPAGFLLDQAWAPGWRATLDGEPVALHADPGTGLVAGAAPRGGVLRVCRQSSPKACSALSR